MAKTHTMKYGADKGAPKATAKTETAREFAERGVVERHGEAIRNNPTFESMVDEETRQIEDNRKSTEAM